MVWTVTCMGTPFMKYLQFCGTFSVILLFIFHVDGLCLKGDCKLLEDISHFISFFSIRVHRGTDSVVRPGQIYQQSSDIVAAKVVLALTIISMLLLNEAIS